MKALIHVTLKGDVLDPQGKAIQRACGSLGYPSIRDVRQGKLFQVELDAADASAARALLSELAEKLLSNPVIEDYELVSLDAAASDSGGPGSSAPRQGGETPRRTVRARRR